MRRIINYISCYMNNSYFVEIKEKNEKEGNEVYINDNKKNNSIIFININELLYIQKRLNNNLRIISFVLCYLIKLYI